MKEWYDGYHFGDADIYCPWDVINYVDDLLSDPNVQPKSYWINSSGNDLVKHFIEQADTTTKDEIEQLIAGNAVEKRIRSDLTYDEIDNSIDNIWSVLFTTGYLTRLGKAENGVYKLIIPNQEVREVFVLQIREWFNQIVANNRASTDKINQGFLEGEAETIQQEPDDVSRRNDPCFRYKGTERGKRNFLSRHFAWHFEELFWLGCEIKQRIRRWFCGYSAQTEKSGCGNHRGIEIRPFSE